MSTLETVLYTGRTHITGGRDGRGRSDDGAIDVKLAHLGSGRPGSNPEQLLGIAWSACFIGAMRIAAADLQVKLPAEPSVDAEVSLGKTNGGLNCGLAMKMSIDLPGLDEAVKQQLVGTAHQTCPYSLATRGNIDVEFVIL